MKNLYIILASTAIITLSGCGGGSSSDSETIASNALVTIVNGTTKELCDAQDYADNDFEGYSDYTDFKESGGVATWDYFSGTKTCSEYSDAMTCVEQDISESVGGSDSCVSTVIFPNAASTTTDSNVVNTNVKYMTQDELNSDTLYYEGYSNYKVYKDKDYSEDQTNEEIFNDITNYARISDNYYRFSSDEHLLEIKGFELKDGTLSEPITHYSTTNKELIGDASPSSYQAIGSYIESDEYIDFDDEKFKFSKVLNKDLLHTIYPDITFSDNDYGQFIYWYDSWGTSLYINLYLNESAMNKILIYLQPDDSDSK